MQHFPRSTIRFGVYQNTPPTPHGRQIRSAPQRRSSLPSHPRRAAARLSRRVAVPLPCSCRSRRSSLSPLSLPLPLSPSPSLPGVPVVWGGAGVGGGQVSGKGNGASGAVERVVRAVVAMGRERGVAVRCRRGRNEAHGAGRSTGRRDEAARRAAVGGVRGCEASALRGPSRATRLPAPPPPPRPPSPRPPAGGLRGAGGGTSVRGGAAAR